ncbi:MAG: sodium/proton-translocating pyrophosphatase [SAR324 cluster bacterium]|nr:sodium/proton-translocating pyrophosphatase [SAR324 cluster bacterium]
MVLQLAMGAGLLALLAAFIFNSVIKKKPAGNEKMTGSADEIAKGAMTFLTREYKVLSIFVIIVAAILWFSLDVAGTDINEGMYTVAMGKPGGG